MERFYKGAKYKWALTRRPTKLGFGEVPTKLGFIVYKTRLGFRERPSDIRLYQEVSKRGLGFMEGSRKAGILQGGQWG